MSISKVLPYQQHSQDTGSSRPRCCDTNRCLPNRVGVCYRKEVLCRRLRSIYGLLNQHLGTVDSPHGSIVSHNQFNNCSGSLRQLYSSSMSQKRRLTKLSPEWIVPGHIQENDPNELESVNCEYQRSFQCSGRPTVSSKTYFHRMEPSKKGFLTYPGTEPIDKYRFICNKSEQTTSKICLTLPRYRGNTRQCSDPKLVPVRSCLPVPSYRFDFKGFDETDIIKNKNCYFHKSSILYKTLAHGTCSNESPLQASGCNIMPNSCESADSQQEEYPPSRLAVIRRTLNKQFPSCSDAVSLMSAPIRDSSSGDYERKFQYFINFLRDKGIPWSKVELQNVIQFFMFLFNVKKLLPSTISHYKSALVVPLKVELAIDLNTENVAALLKAMSLKRPTLPPVTPSWDLHKVLIGIGDLPNNISIMLCLERAAFLLLLATGWRISELQACVRDSDFCSITNEKCLKIRPHPSFLAKNECPKKRWSHKSISSLIVNNAISKLCPVNALEKYLYLTKDFVDGPLFLNPSDNKPMTRFQLSKAVCSLVLRYDSNAKVKVRKVRKMASSYALQEAMDIKEVSKALRWRDPATFLRHYFGHLPQLDTSLRLPSNSS